MVVPFAEIFGVRPWEIEGLTTYEFEALEQRIHHLMQQGTPGGESDV